MGLMLPASVKGTTRLSYLDIPFLGEFYPAENLKLFAGPAVSFFLAGTDKAEIHLGGPFPSDLSDSRTLTTEDVQSTDIGILAGAGYSFGRVDIEARYSFGLTDHAKSDAANLKNNVLQIIVGVNF